MKEEPFFIMALILLIDIRQQIKVGTNRFFLQMQRGCYSPGDAFI